MNRDINIVEHIIIHCKRIIEKTDCVSKEDFLSNKDLTDIVCFNYLQAGELVKLLSNNYREQYLPSSLSKIAGLRDKIAHGYKSIDFELLYKFSKDDVFKLLEICEKSLIVLKRK